MDANRPAPEHPQGVKLRAENPALDRSCTLLRWWCADVNRVVNYAITYRTLYQPALLELGLPGDSAWVLSVFALRDGWTPDGLRAGTNQRRYQTVIASKVLDAGYAVWPTDVTSADDSPYPTNPVHYDIHIADHTLEVPTALKVDRASSTAADRQAARASIAAHFQPALALWDAPVEL